MADMELATAVLGRLLPKLGTLTDKYKLQKGVRGEIKFLQAEIESMQAALKKVSKLPSHQIDDNFKIWVRALRDLCYDVDDRVDLFMMRIEDAPVGAKPLNFRSFFDRTISLLTNAKVRHQITNDIKVIVSRIVVLSARLHMFKFNDIAEQPDTAVICVAEAKLVGTDGPAEEISNLLTQGNDVQKQKLMVVSIVGVGGLGKTSIANLVYERLWGQFDCQAFVSVSPKPNMKQILSSILWQVSKDKCTNAGEKEPEELIWSIREFLNDKRYFLVFDDLWDSQLWQIIKPVLIENSNGSAVLTTSRRVDIAEDFDVVYRLRPLSDTDSRKLFFKRLSDSGGKCPSTLADISEKLIAKCNGIPLAIITLASLLASNPSIAEDWPNIFGYEFEQGPDSVRGISSYTDLHGQLKSCLLYLSMFPKGYEISGEHLVCCWIAEDFIDETEGRSLQEVGEGYLNELINRNLIEPLDVDAGGKILSCRVHDRVHQLIIPLSTQDNFVTILDGRQGINLPNRAFRLSIHANDIQHSLSQMRLSQVRSLVVSGDTMPSLSKFTGLRVLDLGRCDSLQDDHLKGIQKSLKYLVIGGKHITGIPKQIARLKLLQTLDLRASCLKELPESVFRVKSLQRLWVKSDMKIPVGIAKMDALQELGDINISKPELLKELRNLTKLRVLRIAIWSWNESLKSNDESLMSYDEQLLEYLRSLEQGMQNIQSLSISTCCSLDFMNKLDAQWSPPSLEKLEIQHSILYTLPGWMRSLQNLSSLSIEIDKLSQQIVDILGNLHNLCLLSLTSNHATEGKFGVCTDGFQKLTSFYLASNAMGKIFAPESAAMKMLKRVKLSFQASRTKDVNQGFDFGLEDLCSLKHVDIEIICFNVSRRVVENAEAAILEALSRGCSRYSNLEIRRVREESMIEEVVLCNTEQEQQKKMKKRKKAMSSSKKIRVTVKIFRQKRRKELLEKIRPFLIDTKATL